MAISVSTVNDMGGERIQMPKQIVIKLVSSFKLARESDCTLLQYDGRSGVPCLNAHNAFACTLTPCFSFDMIIIFVLGTCVLYIGEEHLKKHNFRHIGMQRDKKPCMQLRNSTISGLISLHIMQTSIFYLLLLMLPLRLSDYQMYFFGLFFPI